MKKKIIGILLVVIIATVGLATTASASIGNSYNSTFSFRVTLDGHKRRFVKPTIGINISNTQCTPDPGHWFVSTTAKTFDVQLRQGLSSKGTIYNWPMSNTTYNGKWNNVNSSNNSEQPGKEYFFRFLGQNNLTTNGSATQHAIITGNCQMYCED